MSVTAILRQLRTEALSFRIADKEKKETAGDLAKSMKPRVNLPVRKEKSHEEQWELSIFAGS